MKFNVLVPFIIISSATGLISQPQEKVEVWRSLLEENPNCVTWVSATVRVEVSVNGRSLPPQEQKLEALGTILSSDGLTVLSLTKVDPTSNILARLRSPGASVQANYTEVLILMQDGTEIPARLLLKDVDLDLAYLLPLPSAKESQNEFKFPTVPIPSSLSLIHI